MATEAGERVNAIAVVGDQRRRSRSARFAGGRLVAVAGDVELDLREARPVPTGARIRVWAVLGEAEVTVPRGWVVDVATRAVVEDVADRTAGDAPTGPDPAPRLALGGVAVLGDVVVRHAD